MGLEGPQAGKIEDSKSAGENPDPLLTGEWLSGNLLALLWTLWYQAWLSGFLASGRNCLLEGSETVQITCTDRQSDS